MNVDVLGEQEGLNTQTNNNNNNNNKTKAEPFLKSQLKCLKTEIFVM